MCSHAKRFVSSFMALFLSGLPVAAWAQAYEVHSGPYTLRASTVGSESISATTATAHGIKRSPSRALLNATLIRNGKTVPARMSVHARNLAGMSRTIDMQQTADNAYISYMGVYEIVQGEVLDFTVKAQPEGGDRTLALTFRDRIWGGGGR